MRSDSRPRARASAAATCIFVAVLALSAGCSAAPSELGPGSDRTVPTASATPSASPRTFSASQSAYDEVEGSYDVGDYSLFLQCQGSGEPTVVYLHGYIADAFSGGRVNSGRIPSLLRDRVRVCWYDRVNVGDSGETEEIQTGLDAVADLHELLAAAEVPGPYVLLGASFGGLIAYEYALTHPGDVVGMVLLDPALPGDHAIFELIPEDERSGFDVIEISDVERLDDAATSREAEAMDEPGPSIPVIVLATEDVEIPPTWPLEEVTTLIRDLQQQVVDRFEGGELVLVESPHYMEAAIPDRIADEVHRVLDGIGPAS